MNEFKGILSGITSVHYYKCTWCMERVNLGWFERGEYVEDWSGDPMPLCLRDAMDDSIGTIDINLRKTLREESCLERSTLADPHSVECDGCKAEVGSFCKDYLLLRRLAADGLQANGFVKEVQQMDNTEPKDMEAMLDSLNGYCSIPQLDCIQRMRAWVQEYKKTA